MQSIKRQLLPETQANTTNITIYQGTAVTRNSGQHHQYHNLSRDSCYQKLRPTPPISQSIKGQLLPETQANTTNITIYQGTAVTRNSGQHHQYHNLSRNSCYQKLRPTPPILQSIKGQLLPETQANTTNITFYQGTAVTRNSGQHHQYHNLSRDRCYQKLRPTLPISQSIKGQLLPETQANTINVTIYQGTAVIRNSGQHHQYHNLSRDSCYQKLRPTPPISQSIKGQLLPETQANTTNITIYQGTAVTRNSGRVQKICTLFHVSWSSFNYSGKNCE